MRRNPNENLKPVVIWRVGLLLVFAIVWFDSKYQIILFANPVLNCVAFIVAMLIPFALFVFSLTLQECWMKVIGIIILSPLMIVAGFWAWLGVIALPVVVSSGELALLSTGKTIDTPYWRLRYYHGDGYVIVAQEKEIVPGILVSREIYHTGGPDPVIEILDDNTIKMVSQPGMPEQGIGEFRLNRFVYF